MTLPKTLSLKEKLGYGLGDTASNIIFQVIINFILFFYTDVYGLSAAAAGTLMLAVRIMDAFTDPVVGALADRTRSRFGRYRPYLIYASLPFGILAVLAFTTPQGSDSLKLIYAYASYALLMLAYTVVNIPYSALGGVLTEDSSERASLQAYRFAMAMAGGALVTALVMPMVKTLGGGDQALGFQLTMAVFSLIACLCFIACFFLTSERVQEPPRDLNVRSMLSDFFALFKNSQWLIVAAIAFFTLVLVAVRGAATPYYVKYVLQREELVGQFITAGMLASFAGALLTNWLNQYFDKLFLFRLGCWGMLVFHAVLFLIPSDQLVLIFVLFMLANLFQLIVVPLMFSFVPDTADYGRREGREQNMAMYFSGHLLAVKLGFAVGGASAGWLLSLFHYRAGLEPTSFTLLGISLMLTLLPAVCALLNLLVFIPYKLGASQTSSITKQ